MVPPAKPLLLEAAAENSAGDGPPRCRQRRHRPGVVPTILPGLFAKSQGSQLLPSSKHRTNLSKLYNYSFNGSNHWTNLKNWEKSPLNRPTNYHSLPKKRSASWVEATAWPRPRRRARSSTTSWATSATAQRSTPGAAKSGAKTTNILKKKNTNINKISWQIIEQNIENHRKKNI